MDLTGQHITFIHSPLLHGTNGIRLLRILPSKNETAAIQCQVLNYSLESESHQYDALSYAWGNPIKTLQIFIDEYVLEIKANLHAALLQLRDHSFK